MQDLSFYFIQALWIAWRRKSFWLLGFIQMLCLFLVLRRLNSIWWLVGPKFIWQLGLLLVFSLSSAMLWLQIKAALEHRIFLLSISKFFDLTLKAFLLTLLATLLAVIFKAAHAHWTFFVLFSTLLGVSAGVAILAAVLYNLNIARSVIFVWNFWRLKPSALFIVSFIVLIAHGCAYYFAHAFPPAMPVSARQFPVLAPSATIWMLFLALCLVIAFLAAFLNTAAVIIFLSTNEPKKSNQEQDLRAAAFWAGRASP